MAKTVRVMAAVVTGTLLLGSGVAHAEAPAKKRKPKATTTTLVSTQEDTSTLRSTLSVNACSISLDDEEKLAPLATGNVGTIAFEGSAVTAVSLPNPVPVSIKENGMRFTCTIKSGSDTNPTEDSVVIDVVDFPGTKGVDAAKRAYATVKAAYQPAKLSAADGEAPEDVTGLGDEAFVAKREQGIAQAYVAWQGEILVRVDASQASSSVSAPLDFDAVKAVAASVLAKAVAEVPTATGSSSTSSSSATNPKGNTGTGQITTSGAINATWVLRIADLGITEACGIIPLITEDGKMTASINVSTVGDVTFESTKFSQNLRGKGGTLELPTDPEGTDPYHVTFNATVKDQFTGKNKTTIKGSFDFTCAHT